MSSPAQLAANIANAQQSTGPRTEQGKSASSQNAVKSGLFSTRDFIRPGEESLYTDLSESVRRDLAPVGDLECTLADEIRRAMWRLRRCGETEGAMVEMCLAAATGPDSPVPDPMQNEATARLQHAVDRSRSQCHRLIHRCTAELRKLQTERHFRREELDQKLDLSSLGVTDVRVVRKSMDESTVGQLRNSKLQQLKNENAIARECARSGIVTDEAFDRFFDKMTATKQSQPATPASGNSRCACGSGRKFKRCCALRQAA